MNIGLLFVHKNILHSWQLVTLIVWQAAMRVTLRQLSKRKAPDTAPKTMVHLLFN